MRPLAFGGLAGIVAEALVGLIYSIVIIAISKTEWRFLKNIFVVSHMYVAKGKCIVFAILSSLACYRVITNGSIVSIVVFSFSFMTMMATLLINISSKISPMKITSDGLMSLYLLAALITFGYVVLMGEVWVRIVMATYLLIVATYYLYKMDAWGEIFGSFEETYEYLYPVIPFVAVLVTILI